VRMKVDKVPMDGLPNRSFEDSWVVQMDGRGTMHPPGTMHPAPSTHLHSRQDTGTVCTKRSTLRFPLHSVSRASASGVLSPPQSFGDAIPSAELRGCYPLRRASGMLSPPQSFGDAMRCKMHPSGMIYHAPTGGLIRFVNNNVPVEMIWHYHKHIRGHIREMGQDLLPTFMHDSSQGVHPQCDTRHLPKQAFLPQSDDREEISSCLGIIVSFQADGTTAESFRGFFCHRPLSTRIIFPSIRELLQLQLGQHLFQRSQFLC
jgi:hypothetical protein